MRRSLLLTTLTIFRSISSAPYNSSEKMTEILKVKKLSEFANIPVRGSEYAAGYDLFAAADAIVPARGKALIMTDLAIEIPMYTYARIAPRSGLAWKHSIDTGAGVIDYDYRGNVGVILFNLGPNDFEVKRGDRIAQMILERISMAGVEEVQELGLTTRGEGGFGSTGVEGALKKLKTLQDNAVPSSNLSALLLFVQDVQAVFGEVFTLRLKELIFSSNEKEIVQLEAIMNEYKVASNKESLKQNLNILLKSN